MILKCMIVINSFFKMNCDLNNMCIRIKVCCLNQWRPIKKGHQIFHHHQSWSCCLQELFFSRWKIWCFHLNKMLLFLSQSSAWLTRGNFLAKISQQQHKLFQSTQCIFHFFRSIFVVAAAKEFVSIFISSSVFGNISWTLKIFLSFYISTPVTYRWNK